MFHVVMYFHVHITVYTRTVGSDSVFPIFITCCGVKFDYLVLWLFLYLSYFPVQYGFPDSMRSSSKSVCAFVHLSCVMRHYYDSVYASMF